MSEAASVTSIDQIEFDRVYEFVSGLTMDEILYLVTNEADDEDWRIATALESHIANAIKAFGDSEPEMTYQQVSIALHFMLHMEMLDYAPEPCDCTPHQPGCVHYHEPTAAH